MEERAAVAVVCVVAATIYLTLIPVPFLSWDDDKNVSANPYYLYLGWWRLWAAPYFGMYVPVISSVWAGLFRAGGGAAWVFRVLNAALHVVNILLVWRLIRALILRVAPDRVDERTPVAVLAGVMLFALHPLQTAAVAWISGGRDLLATALGLAAVLLYFRGGRRYYLIATALFVAGLLSKPSIAGIPLAILAYTALFEPATLRSAIRSMSVWCLLVLLVAVGTSIMQSEMTAIVVPMYERPLVALDAIGFYLLKLVWPGSLNVDYGRTPEWIWSHPAEMIATLAAVIAATSVLWWLSRRRRAYAAGVLWILLLSPVIGITTFAFQRISTVADHYAYLPMAAAAALAAIAINEQVKSKKLIWVVVVLGTIVGSALTWERLRAWRSDVALFEDTYSKNPHSFVALSHLALSACKAGEFDRGLDFIRRALEVHPEDAAALEEQAYCLYHAGRYDQVIAMQMAMLDSDTQFSLEHNDQAASNFANLIAGAYFQRGDLGRGWIFLCQARAVTPFDQDLQLNAADIARLFRQRGVTPSCLERMTWRAFAELVTASAKAPQP